MCPRISPYFNPRTEAYSESVSPILLGGPNLLVTWPAAPGCLLAPFDDPGELMPEDL